MDHYEINRGAHCIDLTQDTDNWRDFVKTATKVRV